MPLPCICEQTQAARPEIAVAVERFMLFGQPDIRDKPRMVRGEHDIQLDWIGSHVTFARGRCWPLDPNSAYTWPVALPVTHHLAAGADCVKGIHLLMPAFRVAFPPVRAARVGAIFDLRVVWHRSHPTGRGWEVRGGAKRMSSSIVSSMSSEERCTVR